MAALPTRLAPAHHQELRHLSGAPPDPSRESVVQMIVFRPQPALTSVCHWVSSPAAALGPGSQLHAVPGIELMLDDLARRRDRDVLEELGTPEGAIPRNQVREVGERGHEHTA
jgi:hypothetical protein